MGSEANAAVSQPLGYADLVVAVFLAREPDNVAALHLHNLVAGVPQAQSRRCLTVVAEDAVEDGVDVNDEDGGGDSSEDPDSDPCFDFTVPAFD
ncbi:TCP family transcription factor 4 [Actinidia rufa]|uniref:TCP family transcription factor 4 n=1 Tax=Actinidia rufa TaxID=165716 RepID=A0A7J0GI36_9ERIC|nr:TCP family transcription factor 4 [Actinidia rufa]